MTRRIHATLVACVALILLSVPSNPGLAAAQSLEESALCGAPGTPAASPGATPATDRAAGSGGHRIELESGEALVWPAGDRGVLLLHGAAYDAASWEPQAEMLAVQGFTVLSLESLSPEAIQEGIGFLTVECGATGVTVIGASAGGNAALGALAEDPPGVTGLVLLGATGEVGTLGEYPKLFTASEGEGLADRLATMADEAPGDRNETLVLPGSAHAQAIFESEQGDALIGAILAFLDETAP
ncbi:MAG: alpha/beta hydrolase [Chloroflexota bacterium]|nr:alpha/beta hydrolase [Chloroflexota bacterium]